ncbi:PP-loop domain protein [Pyrolobus fumarii 1A]|uniref:PP-loop domain protein n=1 Tax=Pyrolobus fumarii (strain DSM 11204 / 1A) TaxID=694429 RepID=G0EF95_PYRF1|nr:phosphoadenosine phosphosulfate reductase family protein [Pyrolobus fumarii]AEM38138.1 PP-loop domain protein [Pyrolobus fumarii 1A]
MTELYPVIRNGRAELLQGGAAEAVVHYDLDHRLLRAIFWLDKERGADVTKFLERDGTLRIGDIRIPYRLWVLAAPYVHAYTLTKLEDHVDRLVKLVGKELRGRRVALGYSGGKDSTAALLVLLALAEKLGLKLDVLYIHIPYIESPRNVKFVEEVAKRLSIDIEIIEAPRRKFRSYLLWRGLPRRGDRWCTFFKVKPMREYKKRHRGALEVVADRIMEAPKRLEKLAAPASRHEYLSGRKFRPTYLMTLLDVVKLTREADLVHPAYFDGLPRVACTLCPFKSLHEFTVIEELEDPGFIETVLKKEHRKWYSDIPYEVFAEHHLWRYPRKEAILVYRAKQVLEKMLERGEVEEVKAREVNENYRSLWVESLPEAPILNPPDVAARVLSARIVKPVPPRTTDKVTRQDETEAQQ